MAVEFHAGWFGLSLTQYTLVSHHFLVPEALDQKALLNAVLQSSRRPHTVCQQCHCDGGLQSDGNTHLVVVEGTMILAIR